MSFVDSICFSRKGRIGGEVGGYTRRVQTAWLSLDSAFRNALVGSGWAISILLCMNGLRKQSSHLHGVHFQQGSVFPSLGELLLAECRDYCKLVNRWLWFES